MTKPDIIATTEAKPMDTTLHESLGVSGSWAILSGNMEGNSPHLSPISSEGSLGRVADESTNSQQQDIEMSGYESISSDITESTGMVVFVFIVNRKMKKINKKKKKIIIMI